MKTYQPKKEDIKRGWHLVDVGGEILGRSATKIAELLMGKHKPRFAKHIDMGDNVVVVNAKNVKVTGKKADQKVYQKHSNYPGGFKEVKFSKLIEEQPEKVIELAVSRMLPKNRLRSGRMRRLKVFAGKEHPYEDRLEKSGKSSKSSKGEKGK